MRTRVLERINKADEANVRRNDMIIEKEIQEKEKIIKQNYLALKKIQKKNEETLKAQRVYEQWINDQILIECENGQSKVPEQIWKNFRADDIKAAYALFVVPNLLANDAKVNKKKEQMEKLDEIFKLHPTQLELVDAEQDDEEQEENNNDNALEIVIGDIATNE